MRNKMKSTSMVLVALRLMALAGALPGMTHTVRTAGGPVKVVDLMAGSQSKLSGMGSLPEAGRNGISIAPNIVGGNVVKDIKKFPQVVTIIVIFANGQYDTFCSGVIIDKRVVLSAAHCFDNFNKNLVFAACSGTVDIFTNTNRAKCAQILEVWSPEQFDQYRYYLGYDMAILKLGKKITGTYGKRVKVSFAKPKQGLAAKAVGFGLSKHGRQGDGKMRYVNAKVVLNEGQCKILNKFKLDDDPDLICAKSRAAAMCSGDSGGPLLVSTGKKADYICVGALSFGLKGCKRGTESAYTSLYSRSHAKVFKFMVRKLAKGTYLLGKLPKA